MPRVRRFDRKFVIALWHLGLKSWFVTFVNSFWTPSDTTSICILWKKHPGWMPTEHRRKDVGWITPKASGYHSASKSTTRNIGNSGNLLQLHLFSLKLQVMEEHLKWGILVIGSEESWLWRKDGVSLTLEVVNVNRFFTYCSKYRKRNLFSQHCYLSHHYLPKLCHCSSSMPVSGAVHANGWHIQNWRGSQSDVKTSICGPLAPVWRSWFQPFKSNPSCWSNVVRVRWLD